MKFKITEKTTCEEGLSCFNWRDSFKKPIALFLIITFSWTNLIGTNSGWAAEAIQMQNGQPQAVADPFAVTATSQSSAAPVDFLQNTSPLSAPTIAAETLPPARVSFSNTAGLTTASVSTLAGSPRPYLLEGSTAETKLQSPAANLIQMNYKVSSVADFSGVSLSFDNASTPAVETQSISALSSLTFGIKGDMPTIRLQIEDINGVKDEIDLNGMSNTTEKFWRIPASSISSALDKTKIKSIRFIAVSTNGGTAAQAGAIVVRVNGLNLNVPSVPVVTSTVPAYTNQSFLMFSGTKEANTAILINNVEIIPANNSTAWTATVNFPAEGSNVFNVTSKNAIGKISTIKTVTVSRDTVIPIGSININSGAAFVKSQTVTLNLSGSDSRSGISTMSFSTDNVNWTAPEIYATSKLFTLPGGDGNKTVYVKYFDKAGNASVTYSKIINLDTTIPVGTVNINSGAVYATAQSVTLNLAAADAGAGVGTMSFSTNGTTWSAAVAYASSKVYTLPAGDGVKTVYVKYFDKVGNVSAVISKQIVLDMSVPTGSVKINDGAISTNQTNVTLNLSATDLGTGVEKMSFSTDNKTWSAAENYAVTKDWTLASGNGARTVYVKYLDKAGRWSAVSAATILLDTVVPTGSININSGAIYAATTNITLNLSAIDAGAGIGTMSFSTDNLNWTAPVSYATTKSFVLPAGDGSKTVYVKYFDKAGNVSAVYLKSIVLDTLPPTGTIAVNNGAQVVNQTAVTLNLDATDAGLGLSKMSFSANGMTWSPAEAYAATKAWNFTAGDGNKTVYAKFQDKTGKWSAPVSVTVALDTVKPTGSIDINSGAIYTNSSSVTLNLAAADTGSGATQMSFSTDNANWSALEVFSAVKIMELPVGDGNKTVYVKYLDKAGNESAVYSKTIALDMTPPDVSVVLFDEKLLTNKTQGNVDFSAVDGGSGIDQVRFTLDQGVTWSVWKNFSATDTVELSSGDGEKEIRYEVRDRAGNVASAADRITLDQTPPVLKLLTETSVVHAAEYVFEYLVDGVLRKESRLLAVGINEFTVSEADLAGNTATINWNVDYETSWDVTLENGTLQHFEEGVLKYEISLDQPDEEGSAVLAQDAPALRLFASFAPANEGIQGNTLPNVDVYSGGNLQVAIDNAQAGQTVLVHAGSYSGHFVLKQGVHLIGEDRNTVILFGGYEVQKDVLTALGDNKIENLTITGGGQYSWGPSSALNIQGEHVQVLNNNITGNKDYGIYISGAVSDVLIEKNLIKGNNVGVQLPKDGNQIRFNTLVKNSIAVNILNGTAPIVENNIISDNTYQSIYEFGWGLIPTNGRAIVRNNTLFNNPEKGGAYGLNLPPAVGTRDGSNWSQGNILANPQFVNPSAGDYSVTFGTPSFERGAFVPEAWKKAVARAAQFTLNSNIQEIKVNGIVTGYKILYPAGTVETFMNDGTETLDTAGPVIEISASNPILVRQSSYDLTFALDGLNQTKHFTLQEGLNIFSIEATDELGNQTLKELRVTLDTVVPVGSLTINHHATVTNYRDITLTLDGTDATSGVERMRFSFDSGSQWTDWETFAAEKNLDLTGANGIKTIQYQIEDEAGNLSVVYSKAIALDIPIQVTSTASTTSSDYVLRYLMNGTAYQENWHLAPGSNLLVIEDTNTTSPVFLSFRVDYAASPAQPLTEILEEDNSLFFNLDLTQMRASSGELLSDLVGESTAQLGNTQFNDQGQLTDAILKFQSGRAIQLSQGKVRQILDASGTLQQYSDTGELEAMILPDGGRTSFAEHLDDFTNRNVLTSAASLGSDVTSYNLQGQIRYGLHSGGRTIYENGILKQVTTSNHFVYDYSIIGIQGGGYESRLQGSISDTSIKPTLLRYDSNQSLTYVESSDGSQFEFQNGVLTQATNSSGEQTQYDASDSLLGEILNFDVTRAGVQRTYNERGQLSQIVTSSGLKAQVANNTISRIDLGNGQYATDLTFDVNGNIVESKVHNTDGSIAHYVGGILIETELSDHSVVTYTNGKARLLKTADGRIYQYVYGQDGLGQETSQVLRAELLSYTSSAGNVLDITAGNLTDFVLHETNLFDNIASGSQGSASPTFIPLLNTPDNIIRNLRLDTDGKMISAEILNKSGDQYFVVNGNIEKIITSAGKTLTFHDAGATPTDPVTPPLTSDESVFRNQLIEQNLQYFKSGQGIDPVSGLPFDNLQENGSPTHITQPTAIGFYLQILGAVLDGSYSSSSMSKQNALDAAQKALGSLLTLQSQIGWRGLVPFANLGASFSRYGDSIGLGDNANLTQSLAILIGSIEKSKVNSGLNVSSLSALISQTETFISNQSAGYASFCDSSSGLLRSSYNIPTEVFSGSNDRLMNEYRTGIAFIITRFNLPQAAWDNLVTVIRSYQDKSFNDVLNAVPFDGGAFQMFWPLLRADQELSPSMKTAAWNFLYSLADYASKNSLPGFPSASFDSITQDYQGKIGVPDLAETRDSLNTRTISVYSLASAYALAPQFVLAWLKAIQEKYPTFVGDLGFYDSITLPESGRIGAPVVGKRYYAIDQASFLLGLLNNAGADFNTYLDTRGYRAAFDSLYDKLQLNITPVQGSLAASPFAPGTLSSIQAPETPSSGFHLSNISGSQTGQVNFDYLFSPKGELNNVDVTYNQGGIERSTDLLTYFEQTQNLDEKKYLLNSPPVNLFDTSVERGAVFTQGQGSSVESRVQDPERGFVKAFDYQIVPNGQPVGYYSKFNNMDLSDVDFITFSVRRDTGSQGPKSLEVKLEGLGETFIVDNIPTGWTRVVLPLKKPNTDLSRIAILIHDQVSQAQSGRIYLGDISLFSLKDYPPSSWQSATGLTPTGIETLAENFLTGGANTNAPQNSTVTQLVLNADGKIDLAQVASKDGSLVYIQSGQVSKIVTSDGKTIIYKNGEAETVTGASGETASFTYDRDYKNQIQQIKLSEPGIQRIYDTDGHLDRLVFDGLSGDINQGILSSLRTRSESITDLVSDGLNHIKDAHISLNDGRVLVIKNYKLSETIYLSGTDVIYDDDGYVTFIHSKTGDSQYIYQKDVNGNITSVSVKVLKQGLIVTKDVVAFLREDNRIEEAAILLESSLVNVRDIASQLGAFFTNGQGQVSLAAVADPDRNNVLKLDYSIPANPSYMGIYFRVPNLDISKYQLMSVALKGSGNTDQPSVTIELKGPTNDRFTIDGISGSWSDTTIPLDSANAGVYEITMLINPDKINTSGTLYLDDISFFNVRQINVANWEQQLSFNAGDLEQFSRSITQDPIVNPLLYSVPVPDFQELRDFVGLPKNLVFDTAGKVTQFTRGDGTQINVNGDLPVSAQLSNGQVVSYQTNSSNQITAATVTDSSTTQTVNTTQYGYDKVRQTTLSNGQNLEYYYEFDAEGREVTVVHDPQTKETRKFINGLIQSTDNGQGLVTTYSFNSSGTLEESHLSFQGKANLDVTQYEKHGDKTYITDTSGITWIYDAAGFLVQHHTSDGLLYQHTTDTDEHGEVQNLIFLIQSTASDGTIIYYDKAEISRIVFKNGTTFINPKYDSDHNLSGAKVIYEDGSETDYVNQYAVKSTNLFGDVTTYVLPQGKIAYELDGNGKVEFIRIDKEDGLSLRYNRNGDLVNLLTADGTLYQYVYEKQDGANTGRMKVYRRQLAQLAGSPIPFPVSADADSYGNMHVMINGQTVYTAQNQVQVLAINPANGSVDTTLQLNMALPNQGKNFLDFINAVPDGEYVMVIYPQTSSGTSSPAGDFMNGMKLIGGDPSKPYFASQPWIVIGQKGLKVGQLFDGTSTADFNGGTIRLDTESRDVFYLNAAHQLISESEYGFPSNLLGTALHGANMSEMTEVFGTISNNSDQYAAAYFKNYNIKYPESGLYRFLADVQNSDLTLLNSAQLDAKFSGIVKMAEGFKDKAIYYDERYPSNGISITNLRVLKAYLISKGFQVLTADKLKDWISEKGSDSIVLMAQDIAPDTIVNLTSTGSQPARDYLNHGGSLMWLYDIPFYQIGHANGTKDPWGSAGDNYGLRAVLGISVAYEPALSKPVTFYQSTPCRASSGFLGLLSGCYQTGGSGSTATYGFRNVQSASAWSSASAGNLDSLALSQTLHLGFDINELDAWQIIKANFEKNTPAADTDIASVFDANGVILGVRKGDGSQNIFENGKLDSILDREGNHLIDYFYNALGELTATQYLQARRDLDAQIQQSELPVAQLKTKALLQIASNRAIGVQNIQNELNAAHLSLASSRSQVESQRFIQQCHKCGCSECCEQSENPGYSQAINDVNAAQRQVEEDAALALSNVDIEVGNAYTQINQDQVAAIAKIQEKKAEILRSIVQNEIAPVLMQHYRLLLGRDPSTVEMNRWLDAAIADSQNRIDTVALKTELLALPERAARLAEIALIKSDVRAFLDQYTAAETDVRVSQAASLGVLKDELVSLDSAQVSKIMAFLDSQNLHFGYSAFLPLQALLAQNNLNVSTRDIAVKALLIDILTGTINPFAEGDLRLSLFAMERTAKVLGAAPNAVKLTYNELKQIYAANPGLKTVVHIQGNHYVTLISVTDDKVSYIESAMGSAQVPGTTTQGEVVEISRQQFEALWLNPAVNTSGSSEKMGVVLLPEQVTVQPERVIDRSLTKLIKGAFCGIDDAIWITIIVVAAVSGAVQAITATGGNFFTNFLKGFAFGAIVGVVTLGIGTVLSGFASAVNSIASGVLQGIKAFVSPLVSSFQTLGSTVGHFITSIFPTSVGNFLSGAVNLIGRGISAIQSFGSSVIKVATQGFHSLQNFVQTGSILQKVVVESVLGLAVNYGTTKGLTILGVNPQIAMLAGAFASGAFLGAVNAGGGTVAGVRTDVTGADSVIHVSSAFDTGGSVIDGFVLGGVNNLSYQAIPVVSQTFNLSADTTNILQIVSGTLLGSGGNVTTNTLKGLGKNIAGEISISGLDVLGSKIGLTSGFAQFAGLPFNSIIATLTGSASGNIYSNIGKALLGAGVAVGAKIVLNNIKAPEIVTALVGTVASGVIAGLIPSQVIQGHSAGDPVLGDVVAQQGILAGVRGAFSKAVSNFFSSLASNPLTFSDYAQQRGLKNALNLFLSNSLERATLESLYQSTTNLADFAYDQYQNHAATVIYNGQPAREVVLNGSSGKVTLTFDAQNNLVKMQESSRVMEGQFRYDENGKIYVYSGSELVTTPDGGFRNSVYESGKLVLHQTVVNGRGVDYYAEPNSGLSFYSNGNLRDGIIEDLGTGRKNTVRNGIIVAIDNPISLEFTQGSAGGEKQPIISMNQTFDGAGKITNTQVNVDQNRLRQAIQSSPLQTQDFSSSGAYLDSLKDYNGTPAGLADQADSKIDSFANSFYGSNGPAYSNVGSLTMWTAVTALKGFTDILRTGTDLVIAYDSYKLAAANGEFKTFFNNYWNAVKSGNLAALTPEAVMALGMGTNTPNLNRALVSAGKEALRVAQVAALAEGALALWKAMQPLTERFVAGVVDTSTGRLVVGQGGFVNTTIESEIQSIERRLASGLPEDKVALADWFAKPGSGKQFLDEAARVKNIDAVGTAVKNKYLSLDDLKNYKNTDGTTGFKIVRSADEVNLDPKYTGYNPLPHKPGTTALEKIGSSSEFATKKLIRVSSDDNLARPWMMEESQYLQLKSEAQSKGIDFGVYLQDKLQLPARPTRASYFEPQGDQAFMYRESTVNNPSNLSDNLHQVEILDGRLEDDMFILKEKING